MNIEADKFVEKLAKLADPDATDRAELARLRRGLSGESRDLARVYPFVLPRAPSDTRQEAYLQTACLFGLHPTEPSRLQSAYTIARALRRIRDETDSSSIEARFVALLSSHRDELFDHLRYAVSLAKSHKIALRWKDVLEALCWWTSNPTRRNSVQRQWAQDFWGFASSDADTEANADPPPVSTQTNE